MTPQHASSGKPQIALTSLTTWREIDKNRGSLSTTSFNENPFALLIASVGNIEPTSLHYPLCLSAGRDTNDSRRRRPARLLEFLPVCDHITKYLPHVHGILSDGGMGLKPSKRSPLARYGGRRCLGSLGGRLYLQLQGRYLSSELQSERCRRQSARTHRPRKS